jgi:hypothetical protein
VRRRRSTKVPGGLLGMPTVLDGYILGLTKHCQAIPLFFDTVTFFLTFYKSFIFWKSESKSPTIALLFRDGLVYFAAIFM